MLTHDRLIFVVDCAEKGALGTANAPGRTCRVGLRSQPDAARR